MNDIIFSIVIPTYNRARIIMKAVNSVNKQDYENFEIIVIDDGSTDNTRKVIENANVPKLHYFYKANGERGSARNAGISKANGKYITFLDSDDILYTNHFSTALKVIDKFHSPEVFHLAYDMVDDKGNKITKRRNLPPKVNNILLERNPLSCLGIFARKDIALSNLFNEDYTLAGLEDWEWLLRLAIQYPVYTDNAVTSALVNHEGRSVLNINKNNLIKRVESFLKYVLGNPAISAYYKGKMNRFLSGCHSYISLHLALSGKYKLSSVKYLLLAVKEYPASVFKRRFAAIIKHLLIQW